MALTGLSGFRRSGIVRQFRCCFGSDDIDDRRRLCSELAKAGWTLASTRQGRVKESEGIPGAQFSSEHPGGAGLQQFCAGKEERDFLGGCLWCIRTVDTISLD